MPQPEIQVISSLVVQRQNGDVLLIRYDADDERWWLPGDDLVPYEHPDDAARKFLARDLRTSSATNPRCSSSSPSGAGGWHVIFHYGVLANGDAGGEHETAWFALDDIPRTFHGSWEKKVIRRATERQGVAK